MRKNQSSSSAETELRERVKELSCLYRIARIVVRHDVSLKETLQDIVDLLPSAWQYPKITFARITLDENMYVTPGFCDCMRKLTAVITVGEKRRGTVEVIYSEDKPELNEGPFLKEERNLIEAVAREVGLVVERREAEEGKSKLHDQLRHADRLATIGILTAGVAHELNEPLGNILGFAQLAKKCPGLPQQAVKDIERIETASLHAREVIKNLLLFARQTQPQKTRVDLNDVVQEGIYFFEARCAKHGVELIRLLDPGLPKINADHSQINQALVNLVVNALQAMPDGGRLTLSTVNEETYVSLIVEDTGTGMDEKVLEKLFIPFFTTKDVGEGTGLGLPVVHGIVTSHGGSIKVKSEPGKGSRFDMRLPKAKSKRANAKG
ncbi:MAG: ATP-binding protein [Victivallales bacterium]